MKRISVLLSLGVAFFALAVALFVAVPALDRGEHGNATSTAESTSIVQGSETDEMKKESVAHRDTRPIVTIGGAEVRVDIADSPEERRQGLSGRVGLAAGEGMLFIFPDDGLHGFWMKDMRFSIDIIWLDAAGKVVHIAANATPESYPASFLPRKILPVSFSRYLRALQRPILYNSVLLRRFRSELSTVFFGFFVRSRAYNEPPL